MKALIVPAAGRLEIRDIPQPGVGPYDALVKIEVCGICNSTDHKLIAGQMFWAPPFPFVLGHEAVGRVIEVGARVRKFKTGDRVTRPVAFWPGSRPELNVAAGGFAEYGLVRDGAAMAVDGDTSLVADYTVLRQNVVPPHLAAGDAALAISLAETASVLRHLPNLRGRRVLVAGTGVVGLAFALWIKLAGGFAVVLGRRAERLEEARRLGADAVVNSRAKDYLAAITEAAGGLMDGMIEATGDAALAGELLSVLKPDGFASAYGVPPTGVSYAPRWQTAEVEEQLAYGWVADLIRRGWVRPDWFISHTWPLSDALHAFEAVATGKVLKALIRITER